MTAFRATVLTLSGHGHRKIERKASALVALFDQKGCFQNLADVEAVGTHTSVDTCAVAFDRY